MAEADQSPRKAREPRKVRLDLMKDWQVSSDAGSIVRTFALASPRDGSKLAGRLVTLSMKQGMTVDLRCDGSSLQVTVPKSDGASAHIVDRKQRGFAERLDRFLAGQAERQAAGGRRDGGASAGSAEAPAGA